MTPAGRHLSIVLGIISSVRFDPSLVLAFGRPDEEANAKTRQEGDRDRAPFPRFNCPNATESSQLNSFLWTVNGRERPSYFFGTIHVPYTRVWNYIPSNAKLAFHQSDAVHLELDLLDPETISALHRCQLLPPGQHIYDVIPQPLYLRLKRHLQYVKMTLPSWMTPAQKGQGIHADYLFDSLTGNWERKRPIYTLLMINSLTESDIRLRGTPFLDLYLAQEACRLKKTRGAVERVEEQCLPLNDMDLSQVLFALDQTLWQHESSLLQHSSSGHSPSPFSSSPFSLYSSDDLVHLYNCGDLNQILSSIASSQAPSLLSHHNSSFSTSPPRLTSSWDERTARQIDDYFREELIIKRNEKMAERVDRLLKLHPNTSFFFAFGAGHFIGNKSVIDLLQRKGYNISHTPPGELTDYGRVRPPGELTENRPACNVTLPMVKVRKFRTRTRYYNRKKGLRQWLQPITDRSAPVTEGLHLRRSQFKDLWIRLNDDRFEMGAFIQQHLEPTSFRTTNSITMTTPRSSKSTASSSPSLLLLIIAAIFVLSELSKRMCST